jgi:hypothetical protein
MGTSPFGSAPELPGRAIAVADEDGEQVVLDEFEATLLLELTDGLEPATVSACLTCRSRVLAVVAFLDLLEQSLAHERARELIELAEEAPTLHVYVSDLESDCTHRTWRDPLFDEWADAFAELPPVGKLAP